MSQARRFFCPAAIFLLLGLPRICSAAASDDGLLQLQLATNHLAREEWALSAREAALAVFALRKAENPQLPTALAIFGIAERNRGNLERAAELFQEGLEVCARCDEKNHLQLFLAATYRDLRRFREAETLFRKILAEAEAAGDVPVQSQCLVGLKSTALLSGRRAEALPWLEELIRREDASGKPGADRAQTLADLGVLQAEAGDGIQGLESLRRAEILFGRTPDRAGLLLLRNNMARVYVQLGRFDEAFALFERVKTESRQARNSSNLAISLCGSAQILEMRGQIEEAQKRFEECLALEEQNGRPGGQARALNHLGQIERRQGHISRALIYFEKSREVSRSGREPSELTALLLSSGLYTDLHQDSESAARLERIGKAALDLPEVNLLKAGLMNSALLFDSVHLEEAHRKIDSSLALARKTGARVSEMQMLALRATLFFLLNRFDDALSDAEEALSLSQDLKDRQWEALLLNSIGHFALKDHRYEVARIALEQALQIENESIDSIQKAKILGALGIAYDNLGHFYAAMNAYCEATEIIESGLPEVQSDDLLAGLAENAYFAYGRLAHKWAILGEADQAFAIAEKARARMFLRRMGNPPPEPRRVADPTLLQEEGNLRARLETLTQQLRETKRNETYGPDDRLAELAMQLDDARRDFNVLTIRMQQASPAYASLVLPSPVTVPEVQKLLDPEITLIEYLVLDDASWAWVIERDSMRMIRLPWDGTYLIARIDELRQRIATQEPIAEQSSNLYRALFQPLKPYVHHKRLLVVPYGALQALPFGALTPDSGNTWLAERYTFTQLPSASVLPFVLAKRAQEGDTLLALGDPEGTLPAAAAEARAIASSFDTKPLVGREASADAIRKAPRPIGILHLAAHAAFDPVRPLFSRIRLADGELAAHDILGLDLQGTRLVVLSGCETAVGPSDGGELEGLSRAFLFAGASTVAATLWKVDDEASQALMLAFYRHLRQGTPTADALRQAQIEILHGKEAWRHPYYWASFVLTGDPG